MRKTICESGISSGIILMMLIVLSFKTNLLYVYPKSPLRIELDKNWKLISSKDIKTDGSAISVTTYNDDHWYPIHRMTATVLEILQEDAVYPNLYSGKNLEKVPQDLYKRDWWYRKT
ncbi:MAG: hypothetical protein WBV81_18660 [Ignavibacteriaceae bacterium]